MNTSYPHHHSHTHELLTGALRPICAYCMHLLAVSPANTPVSASMRRELEEHHECIEKATARRPDVSMPFN